MPEKEFKVLKAHDKSVTLTNVVNSQYMVSASEDKTVKVWLLPFNVLKHELKVNVANHVSDALKTNSAKSVYLKGLNGTVLELDLKEGKIKSKIENMESWYICTYDRCTQ